VTERAVRALSAGRATLTIGPLVTLDVEAGTGVYGIGDAVPGCGRGEGAGTAEVPPSCTVRVHTDFTVRKGLWSFPEQAYTLQLVGNTGVAAEAAVATGEAGCTLDVPRHGLKWLRAELWGTVRGVRALVAVTGAVYFDE
jgi:hypothetical protein